MSHDAAVDAIIARDHLILSPRDRERLITLYADVQKDLAELREHAVGALEPAAVYRAQ